MLLGNLFGTTLLGEGIFYSENYRRYVVKNHCYRKALRWMRGLFAPRSWSLIGLPKLGSHTI